MKRIVSVWLNNFPLDCLRRRKHHLPSQNGLPPEDEERTPFALVLKDAHGIHLSAPNNAARQSGLSAGMRLADARALLPSLITQTGTPEADAHILMDIATWCQRYTPTVSIEGTDGLWLDVTGATHLFGGETAMLADLSNRLRSIGFESRLGLAETPGAAWAIARFSSAHALESRNILPNGITRALNSLPLAALRIDARCLYLLKRFGLRTIGEICAIPRVSLKRRFPSKEIEEAVLLRLDQAMGHVSEPLAPLRPDPAYYERLSYPEPILATESFYNGLHDLLTKLSTRMEQDRKGATALTFSAYHADGGVSQISIATACPSRDVDHLAHLFRDRIETINPGFGVDVLILAADAVTNMDTEQLALAHRPAGAQNHADLTLLIDRLSNRLGRNNVRHAVRCESHLPERAETHVSALQTGPTTQADEHSSPEKPLRPFRLLDRPEAIHVMAEVPEGPPMRFTWRRVMHRIVRAEGPERIAPEWWHLTSGRPARTRDYYRVEDDQGRRYWLFREGLYRDVDCQALPTWHIHGLFA